MDTDRFYEYEKIGAEDTIRLILLQPSVDLEASIQCSLIRVTLEQCDKDVVEHYVALSYVWGDATLRRQISVDGAKLEITASLDCALRHLRDQSRLLRVWADGICINQNDFEDRNHQVRMMSSIYLLARHTIIFLGPASSESEVVMELLKSQDRRLDRPRRSSRNAQTALDQQLRSLVENHLLANAWFTRTWVLQELVLSADPWVQLGSARVRWDTLYHYAVVAEPSSRELRNARHMYEMGMARSRYMATKDKGNEESLQQNDKQLLKLLKARRGLGVSDGRDMIYAHLSLTDSATQEAMAIRYDLSVADVYESFARSTISSAHNFSILFDIEDVDDLDERREDLPSWVPDVRRAFFLTSKFAIP